MAEGIAEAWPVSPATSAGPQEFAFLIVATLRDQAPYEKLNKFSHSLLQ